MYKKEEDEEEEEDNEGNVSSSGLTGLRSMLPSCIPSFAGIKNILSSVSGDLKEPVAGAYTLEMYLGHARFYLNEEECTNLADYIKALMVEKYQNNDAVVGISNFFGDDPDTLYSRLGTEYAYTEAIKEITKTNYNGVLPCLTGKGEFRHFCIQVVNKTKELKGNYIQEAIAREKAKGEASGLTWKDQIHFMHQGYPQHCQFSGGNSMQIKNNFYNSKKIRDDGLKQTLEEFNNNSANGFYRVARATVQKINADRPIFDNFHQDTKTFWKDAFDGNFFTLVMFPPKAGDKSGLQCVFQIKDGQVFNKLELDHYLDIFNKFNLGRFVSNDAAKIKTLSHRLYNSVIDLINSCNAMGDQNYNVVTKNNNGALVITECTTILLCLLSHILVDFIDQIRRTPFFTPIFNSTTNLADFITGLVRQNKLKIYEESTGCKSVDFDNPTTDPIEGVQKLINLFERFDEPESQGALENPLFKIKQGLNSIQNRLKRGISFGSAITSSSASSASSNSSVKYEDEDEDVALLEEFEKVEQLIKSDKKAIETGLLQMAKEDPENICVSNASSVSSECSISRVIEIKGLTKVEGFLPYKEEEGEDAYYEGEMKLDDDDDVAATFAVAPAPSSSISAAPSSSISAAPKVAAPSKINNKRKPVEEENPVIKALKETNAIENIGGRRPIRKTKNNKKNKKRQTKKKAKRRTNKRRMVKRRQRRTNKKR